MSSPTPSVDFRQHLLVETPEHVVLDYEIAGIGSRALAAIVDHLVLALWMTALSLAAGALGHGAGHLGTLLGLVLLFLSAWGYFALFEGLRGGQTPGKRLNGIRVVMDTGHPVTLPAAILRNLLRVADLMPGPYFVGALMVAIHPRAKRLGDLVAGTIVVRDRPHLVATPAATPGGERPRLGPPRLADPDFRLLETYQSRQAELTPAARNRLAESLFSRFAAVAPEFGGTAEMVLEQLYVDERARRTSPSDRRHHRAGDSANRLIEDKRASWAAFGQLAERAARHGLDSFAADELPAFAGAYREVAADLARARTYQADPRTLAELERLVAAGHNVLYRDRRRTFRRIWLVVTREFPAAVFEARGTVFIALCAFWLPAAAGFTLLRANPPLGEELLPESMLSRADAGEERIRNGKGYYEAEEGERPLMAAEIITNNVQVAFFCFAGGIFFGFGALLSLGFNGLILGALAGHFANRGLLGYLGRFVIGHGVLELNAICIAGAAGFLLGRALIAPGDLPRADAVRLAGRVALRLVGMTVVMLLGAGLIEGLVSAGAGGWKERLAYSGASAVLLLLYLLNGLRAATEMPPAVGGGPARSSPASSAGGRWRSADR
ncbi:MAG TPA: stage II sporulation protein M [Gemmatimonadales bacterium]|nr:stage II sporulation protein M [Gemmatimonadales bacterium]